MSLIKRKKTKIKKKLLELCTTNTYICNLYTC